MKKTTRFILIGFVLIPLGWEAYSVVRSDVVTISIAMNYLASINIFVGFALATLTGHFFIQPPPTWTLAYHLTEIAEVFVILFVGAAVFGVGLFVDQMPWFGWTILLFCSTLLGGFAWTIDA